MAIPGTANRRLHDRVDVYRRGLCRVRFHCRARVLIHACTLYKPGPWRTQPQMLLKISFPGLLEPAIVSVSRASSPNDVVLNCLMSFTHLIHLYSILVGSPLELEDICEFRSPSCLVKAFTISSACCRGISLQPLSHVAEVQCTA